MRSIFKDEITKYYVIILVLISGFFFLEISSDYNYEDLTTSIKTIESENIDAIDVGAATTMTLVSGSDLIPNSKKAVDMANNTKNLQKAIDTVSESGGGVVYLPAGTFYFSQGGIAAHGNEDYAIRCRNNVHLKGAGTNENNTNKLTILKPYYYSPKADGGMDMFYFNNYADTNYNNDGEITPTTKKDVTYTDMNGNKQTLKNQTVYLINADFSDFIVDGDESRGGIAACGGTYKTDGKGFMINLFKDCDWFNVVVKNTDATGFGVDCPLNSTMTNCKAINCGKAATTSDGGASGFGIGVGYSNDESMIITNCVAINNKKFGFFFEHQSRFSNTNYPATTSKKFVVSNSIAGGNMYDFGGLKAYDLTFENVKSISGQTSYSNSNFKKVTAATTACDKYTKTTYSGSNAITLATNVQPVFFSSYSTNVQIINSNINTNVNDLTNSTTEINWAINKGLLPVSNGTKFYPLNTMTRFEVVRTFMIFENYSGKITNHNTNTDRTTNLEKIKSIGYTDITTAYQDEYDVIVWAYNKGLISKDTKFNPSTNCTRAAFITMLYRLAGSPSVSGVNNPFNDVSSSSWYYDAVLWGYATGVVKGSTNSSFSPDRAITKTEVAIFFYRYNNLSTNTNSITYNLNGGIVSGNPTTYKPTSSKITLKNPTKSGYTFQGWTGSNGATPKTSVTIPTGTTGDLAYTANWKANLSSISIKTKPTKTSYYTGDKINSTGLVLNAYYTDSNVEEITGGYTLSPTILSQAGSQKITITYNGKTTSYNVNVTELKISSLSVTTYPKKLEYYVGDTIDTTGLVLTAKYNDGSSKTITSGYTVSPTSFTSTGTKEITVTYNGKTTTFDVIVKKNDVKSIAIKTVPKKTLYYVGDTLDTNGLVLKVIYSNGNTKEIDSGYTVDKTKFTKAQTEIITVTYASKTTTFKVTVNKLEVESITIKSLPFKTTYYENDKFSSKGLTLTIYNNSGFIEDVTSGYTLSIKDGASLTKGTHNVIVTYSGKTTSFDITVNTLQEESLIIESRPTKTSYVVGDKFTTKGLTLNYIDTSGNKQTITSGYTTSIKDGTTLTEADSGIKTITVTYNNKKVTFNITVTKVKKIEVNKSTIKTEYSVGETFEYDDIDITATYDDDTKEKIDNGYEVKVSGGDTFNTPGEKEVTISYGGSQTTIKVNVTDTDTSDDNNDSEENKENEEEKHEENKDKKDNNSVNILFIVVPVAIVLVLGITLFIKFKKNQRVD